MATTESLLRRTDNGRTVDIEAAERWAPVVTGGVIALAGLRRGSLPGLVAAGLGGGLAYLGITRRTPLSILGSGPVEVERVVTVERPAAELYRTWRNFENLPRFMDHLESVTVTGDGRSHWVAKAPLGGTVEWDAEIVEDRPNELIAWRSLDSAEVPNQGSVSFTPAPGGRGTEVRAKLRYHPPASAVGVAVAKLFGEELDQQVREDLRRFKAIMEAGEVPTTEGQPSGRRG